MKVKVILQGQRSNIGGQNRSFYEYFCNIEDSNFIFGMHVYLMELHILSGERSRSSLKVKGKKNNQSGALGGIVFLTTTFLVSIVLPLLHAMYMWLIKLETLVCMRIFCKT